MGIKHQFGLMPRRRGFIQLAMLAHGKIAALLVAKAA
jgi:hypothetical protein